MASGTAKECVICKEEYDSNERCPRILLCGHSVCTSCITQLIQANNTNCPFCRVTFCARTAQEFKINHSLVDLLKEVGATSQIKDSTLVSTEWLKDFGKNDPDSGNELSLSQKVRSNIERRIQLNNELREQMDNEIIYKIKEIEALYQEKGKFLDEENKRLQKLLKTIEQNQIQVDETEKKLGSVTSFPEVAALLEEARKAYTQVKSLSDNATDFLSRSETTCHRIAQIIQQSEQKLRDLEEVLTAIDQEELQAMPDLATLPLREPTDPKKLMVENLRTRKVNSEAMNLAESGLLFSLLEEGGRRRFAKIASNGQRLFWYHYTEKPPTAGSNIIEHEHLKKLVDPLSRLVFLEVTGRHERHGAKSFGRLYIRFDKDNLRAKNFAYLCTGELRSTFANSKFLNVLDKDTGMERVHCGDYDRNDGCGGKTLVPGCAREGKGECDTDWLAGSVISHPYATDTNGSQFLIHSHDIKGLRCEASFGRVEEGMSTLRNAIKYHKANWVVTISDCGIVLNRE